jgi:hypothetical protein
LLKGWISKYLLLVNICSRPAMPAYTSTR